MDQGGTKYHISKTNIFESDGSCKVGEKKVVLFLKMHTSLN
jgi:hypothetical protein